MMKSKLQVASLFAMAAGMAATQGYPIRQTNAARPLSQRKPKVITMKVSTNKEIAEWNAKVDARNKSKGKTK